MNDSLILEVHDLVVHVLTGIYSQETHLPQPLRISISTTLDMAPHYVPDTPLSARSGRMVRNFTSKNPCRGVFIRSEM